MYEDSEPRGAACLPSIAQPEAIRQWLHTIGGSAQQSEPESGGSEGALVQDRHRHHERGRLGEGEGEVNDGEGNI